MKILRVLIDDKLPYLFTILIAIIAYQIDHLINSTIDTPIIEYKFNKLGSIDSGQYSIDNLQIQLTNLNKKRAFKNLAFYIKYKTKDDTTYTSDNAIYDPELIAVAPAPFLPDSCAKSWHAKFNRYQIPFLQPGGSYLVKMTVKHKITEDEFPNIRLTTSETVWLKGSDTQTFIIKNQILINICIILISLLLIVGYAALVNKYQPKTST